MKKLFLSLVALVVATMSYAQSNLVATLSHGTNVKMFYGTYALRDAYNSAVSKDVINLSGGSFQATNITKSITIRGTGIDDANPTYINGFFTIDIPESDTGRLLMEGLRCTGTMSVVGTLNNPYFVKCQFGTIDCKNNSGVIKNSVFANCRIIEESRFYGTSTMQFVNSYVRQFQNFENSAATFINCVITPFLTGYNAIGIGICNSQLLNCIIYSQMNEVVTSKLPSSSTASNCVSIGFSDLFSSNPANKDNMKATTFTDVFKTFTGTYSDSEQFKLTTTAKKKYLGNDGTEVGMYGGILPYSSTPSYPQITKMNVANKTTADGKLSVEIEVSAAQ